MQNSNCEEVQKKVIIFGCRLEKPWKRAATHTVTWWGCVCVCLSRVVMEVINQL